MTSASQIITAFKELDLTVNSNFQTVQKRYRELAKKYHPDICKEPECAEKMKNINEAYKILREYFNNPNPAADFVKNTSDFFSTFEQFVQDQTKFIGGVINLIKRMSILDFISQESITIQYKKQVAKGNEKDPEVEIIDEEKEIFLHPNMFISTTSARVSFRYRSNQIILSYLIPGQGHQGIYKSGDLVLNVIIDNHDYNNYNEKYFVDCNGNIHIHYTKQKEKKNQELETLIEQSTKVNDNFYTLKNKGFPIFSGGSHKLSDVYINVFD